MEIGTSEQEARPKALSTGQDQSGFGSFLIDLKNSLTSDNIRMLSTALDFRPAERDKVETSEDPGHVFVHSLKEKGIINETDISEPSEKLKFCGLHGVDDDVNESFKRYQSNTEAQSRQSENDKGKKTQFLKELKNGYGKQCGGVQAVSFLRTKYAINDLFVEGGIQILEEKHGEGKDQEKWVQLGKYSNMFTNPRAKSKRRIIDGEPGYGKSTLALQITDDWCHEKPWMKDFEILILLRLRQFKNVPSVYSAIKKFLLPKDSKLTEDDIESILDSSSTVILLDGYDEYPDRQNEDTDINHIIRGDMLQEHDVILTTRTSCLPPDHENATVKRIRLTGFDKTSRETYIRIAVACGCSEIADKIHRFLKENTFASDFVKIPLFFAMICYMVKISERFRNLQTVTGFSRHIMKCLCSNRESGAEELDHSKLDEIAFEGLGDNAQQISWDKSNLRDNIGKDLYDEYVGIGILIEEEGFDFDTLEYKTETRFFHKLFAEWHAAHYLAKAAAQQEAEFEQWPGYGYASWQTSRSQLKDKWQPSPEATDSDRVHLLKSLNPNDVHYMYRYACGLNPEAALKIIRHLGTKYSYNRYTLLCITEWDSSLDIIKDTVNSLCSRDIEFREEDSLLLQKSTMKLLNFASEQKIHINEVRLQGCIRVGDTGDLRVMPSNLSLPVCNTLSELGIYEYGRVFTEEETVGILQYAAMCRGLKELQLWGCLFPRSIKRDNLFSALQTSNVTVEWWPGRGLFILNEESGDWEDFHRNRVPMTDEEYQKATEKVHEWAEVRQRRLGTE